MDILLQRTRKHEFLNVSQRWSVEFGITPRYGLRHLLRMTQTAGNPIPEQPGRVLQLCTLNCYGMQGFRSFHGNTAGMYVKYQLMSPLRHLAVWEQAKGSFCVCGGF